MIIIIMRILSSWKHDLRDPPCLLANRGYVKTSLAEWIQCRIWVWKRYV